MAITRSHEVVYGGEGQGVTAAHLREQADALEQRERKAVKAAKARKREEKDRADRRKIALDALARMAQGDGYEAVVAAQALLEEQR